jgi:hypothetical protein
MTSQEAAYKLLNEVGKPLSAKDLARIALERRMVSSVAQDPVASHAQTIEKNIRDDVYNNPKLVFIHSAQGRLIGLPEWNSNPPVVNDTFPNLIEIKAKIPSELFDKIKLAEQAKLKNNFNETVSFLLVKGLSMVSADIKKGLMTQLDSLNLL